MAERRGAGDLHTSRGCERILATPNSRRISRTARIPSAITPGTPDRPRWWGAPHNGVGENRNVESGLQSIWQYDAFDDRRGDTRRHAAGFDRKRQGQGT